MKNDVIIFIIILSFCLLEECPKSKPIKFINSNKCEMRKCTKEQFEHKICEVSNKIMKIQWLNDIIRLGIDLDENREYFGLTVHLNEIIVSIYYQDDETKKFNILLYSLNDEEKISSEIIRTNNVFYLINNNILPIQRNNKEEDYFLICCSYHCDLINKYENSLILNFELDKEFYISYTSIINTLFKLNDNSYFYGFIGGSGVLDSSHVVVNKFNFINITTNVLDIIISKELLIISCFQTENNIIECMIIDKNDQLNIVLLNEDNLNLIQTIYLDKIKSISTIKCIHLQKEIGVYNYFNGDDYKSSILLIKNLIYNEHKEKYELIDIINNTIILDLTSTNEDLFINMDMLKISENRFSILYCLARNKIALILCDLYGKGDNVNNLMVRHYDIPLTLYDINYPIFPVEFLYENHIGFSFSDRSPIIIIFGYNKNKEPDKIVNINNIDNNNLYYIIKINEYLNNNINIVNNIFGYEFKGIKIDKLTGISNGIKYYVNNKEIIESDIINIDDEIYIDYSNAIPIPNYDFYLELSAIYGECDFDEFNSFADSFQSYGKENEDQRDYFQPQIFRAKSLKIEYTFGCHQNCELCEIVGLSFDDQKCSSCNINATNDFCLMKSEGNCFNTSSLLYRYYNTNGSFLCVENNDICPDDYPFENKNTKECKNKLSLDDLDEDDYDINNDKKTIDTIVELLNGQIKNKTLNYTNDTIIEGKNVTFQITTPENQKDTINNKKNNNISSIDLNECEEILKEHYKIKELIILKIDIKRNDTISTQVEYQVINPENGEALNLSLCGNTKIDLYVPINFDSDTHDLLKNLKDQGYDILDSKDSFYNDICTPYTSEDGTDVLIKDRKKDFYNPNLTLCEENCEYKSFDIITSKANCQCQAKTEIKSDTSETGFSPNILLKNFYILESYTNYKVLKCYNLVFNKKYLKSNIGSYIMIFILLCFIIILILNFSSQRKNYEKLFNRIIYSNFLMYTNIEVKKNGNKNKKKKEYVKKNQNFTEPKDCDQILNNRLRLSTVDIDTISVLISDRNNKINKNKAKKEKIKKKNLDEKSSINSIFSDKTLFEDDSINSIKCMHSIKSPKKMGNIRKISHMETGSETIIENKNMSSKNKNNEINKINEKNKINSQKKQNNSNNNSNNSININIFFNFDNFKYNSKRVGKIKKISKISSDSKSSLRTIIDKKLIDNSINNIEKKSITSQIETKKKESKQRVIRNKTLSFIKKDKNKIDNDERIDHILKNIPKNERANYFVDNELNDLEYKYAIKIDFRSFFQYYWSFLKQTHPIIFTFITKNDYNLFLLKVSLFTLSFGLNITMNALFFSDNSMHKLYVDNGKFDFVYNLPQTLYSALFSGFLSFLFEKLSMSEENLLKFKEIKIDDNEIFIKKEKEIKYLIIKSYLYFLCGIIILLFFWYYLCCFCAVYHNTQIPLIKDTLISFSLGLLYPFPLTLIPTIIRIPSLKKKNTCLFRISRIVTFVISLI